MVFGSRSAATIAAIAMALVLGCGLLTAQAQDQSTPSPATAKQKAAPKAAASEAAGYYVDFRVIDGFLYGHTHIAYGRLNARGQPINVSYAGYEPDGGMIGLAIGHVAAVSGSIKTSKESVNFAIVDSYRRRLTEKQYKSLLAAVENAKKHPYLWNVVLHNCNDFMADMAHAVGLKAPPNMVFPYAYISAMRSLNQ
jgi:hypothetical protein